jgi:hypothetical protein
LYGAYRKEGRAAFWKVKHTQLGNLSYVKCNALEAVSEDQMPEISDAVPTLTDDDEEVQVPTPQLCVHEMYNLYIDVNCVTTTESVAGHFLRGRRIRVIAPFMGAKTVVGHFLRHFLPTIYS